MTKDYFSHLDSLRFFAFFLVFLNHITSFLHFPPSVGIPGTTTFTYFQVGDLGVGFFFVLSGFLITYLLEKERLGTGRISLKNFYIRRVLRIWPLYFLAIIIIISLSYYLKEFILFKVFFDKNEILWNIFFLGNVFKAFHYTANEMIGILWSIAVEEQFYLFWPIIFIIFRKYIKYVLALGIIISMYYRYHYANEFLVREFYTFTVMVYLLVGAIAGIYGKRFKNIIKNNSLAIGVCSFLGFIILLSIRGFSFDYAYPNWFISLDGLLFASFFALIILVASFGGFSHQKTKIEKVTEYLGTISYGLYVYHLIAMTLVLVILQGFGFDYVHLSLFKFSIIALSVFALVVLISSISYKYFEKPFLKLKDKFMIR